jgi:hypothetical protein
MTASLVEVGTGPLDPVDLGCAITEQLSRAFRPGVARLEGESALDVVPEAGGVRVRCLVARTSSGRRVNFAGVPIPVVEPCEDKACPVEVVIDWESRPVHEGSVVEAAMPVLRAPVGPEDFADGRFLLGYLGAEGFRPERVPSERLDSCAAWASWAAEVRAALERAERSLLLATARLVRGQAPALAWSMLLPPLASVIVEATVATDGPADPNRAMQLIERFVTTLTGLPERAELAIGPDVAAFLRGLLVVPESAAEPLEKVRAAASAIERLAASIGLSADAFPELLYAAQKVYRRHRLLVVRRVEGTDTPTYEFDTETAMPGAALGIRWELPEGKTLGYGDIVYSPMPKSAGRELYLLGTAPGLGYQLVTENVGGRGRLCSHDPLPAPSVVLYLPTSRSTPA